MHSISIYKYLRDAGLCDVSNVIVHLIHFTNIISDFMCALLPTLPSSNTRWDRSVRCKCTDQSAAAVVCLMSPTANGKSALT